MFDIVGERSIIISLIVLLRISRVKFKYFQLVVVYHLKLSSETKTVTMDIQ